MVSSRRIRKQSLVLRPYNRIVWTMAAHHYTACLIQSYSSSPSHDQMRFQTRQYIISLLALTWAIQVTNMKNEHEVKPNFRFSMSFWDTCWSSSRQFSGHPESWTLLGLSVNPWEDYNFFYFFLQLKRFLHPGYSTSDFCAGWVCFLGIRVR